MIKNQKLLINLSFMIPKATGITTYAKNIIPYLRELNPTLLVSQTIRGYDCYQVPHNLTPDYGKKGHLSRILWTQLNLPKIYQNLNASLLFSPVTEAPLFSHCRWVVMVHDFIPLRFPNWRSPLTYYHRYYIPLVLQQAVHIVCNSQATAKDIIKYCQISPEKITPISLGYDAEHFRFLDLQTKNYFLYIGRCDPYKNLHRLIQAFANLPYRYDYELWLAGTPDHRYTPQLKAQVKELGLTQQVKFLEYVPFAQLPILINQAIALVFPSLWEGFGLPILEAMACGTPAIASNLSSLPEVVGNAGLLINPDHTAEITEAMNLVATDTKLRSQLRELSLNRATEFSWAKTGAATAKVLQQYI
ncbi:MULTISPECIES: glycosyltransferase family 4 protein [Planktothricoides]|uniref:Glycosyltransferase family 1 protein n=2 Tax=Planktothricoides raciborskii TaxID=132608 RepID=A0AAU8JA34_9CYAN|nr:MULTISPECIES: glycosyltransferase family 1 protein [Planktothricoides]KOR37084.1 mannosyltransferase [Planktothricoides sp. SR001]MBD2544661.1 glycosyltransferase family 4 protein [Planktothricoides raciborskii FACHB-1370]MBD2580745.1 glycosyltransferase family 4 protein [Planktothricoides raciborskii FACHB-1261]